jgi:hemerythrin-like domain-containing protein
VAEPLALWHAEHVNFAGLLDLLESQVRAFHAGERPNYDLMADIVFYLRSYSDYVHHPREDVAFALLAEREPGLELEISRLRQEHWVIAAAGEELLRRLGDAAGDMVVTPRAALEAAAATYLVYYRQHLNAEEREIMPRAAHVLTDDDWAAVAATDPLLADPLFGEDVTARFVELRRQIDLNSSRRRRSLV